VAKALTGPSGENEAAQTASASAAFGHGGNNHHKDNPDKKNKHTLSAVVSVRKKIGRTNTSREQLAMILTDNFVQARVEVDSRADTCCLGQTFVMMEDTGRSADVQGFSSDLGSPKGIPIGTCATAFDLATKHKLLCIYRPDTKEIQIHCILSIVRV
jgi:hypothetical protein